MCIVDIPATWLATWLVGFTCITLSRSYGTFGERLVMGATVPTLGMLFGYLFF